MSVERPSAAELLAALRTLHVFIALDGDRLIIRGAPPESEAFLRRHTRALVRAIQAGKGAA